MQETRSRNAINTLKMHSQEKLLHRVIKHYRSLISYSDVGLVTQELNDDVLSIGTATISFKTLYKAPNRFYCHFDFSMPAPFEYMITKTSVGYDGQKAFLYEREYDTAPRLIVDTFANTLATVNGISAGALNDIASLLMPDVDGFGNSNRYGIAPNQDDLFDDKLYHSISFTCFGGLAKRLMIEKQTNLIVESKDFFETSIDTCRRHEIRINESIPDHVFLTPKI